ncbi:TIGR02677 family protein [Pectinatus frisingensis]|nr:TIGR02677 family protein [Pectinatus frisingensis]
MNENDFCRITETAYLNQENTWRYRAIVHYCYKKHEHMQTYVYPEDIYHKLRKDVHFQEYSFEQLEQDLAQLVAWNNLKPHQETGRARSILDFKRRKFRYQCTPYTVEIERMIGHLQSIGEEFGGSLETTQFDRILHALRELIEHADTFTLAELNQTWLDLQHFFSSLVQNSSDYLAHLNSAKVEECMQTSEFILYKDKFSQYLQSFVLGLQRSSLKIEKLFNEGKESHIEKNFVRLADYQLQIPRLGEQQSREAYIEDFRESYMVMQDWFVGTGYRTSELQVLYTETMDTIRRITRFAQRLAEQHQAVRSRKNDYLYLAKWFAGCRDNREAAELSSVLFGASCVRHFFVQTRESDNIDAHIEDEKPALVEIRPRVNTYRERTRQIAIKDQREKKMELLRDYLAERAKHDALLDALVVDGAITLEKLPQISMEVRKTLLGWVARCMQQSTGEIQTETGRIVKLVWNSKEKRKICLRCDDGDFLLPAMKLMVKKGEAF